MEGRPICLQEWYELGCRLAKLNAEVFQRMLRALRATVEAQETLSKFHSFLIVLGHHAA